MLEFVKDADQIQLSAKIKAPKVDNELISIDVNALQNMIHQRMNAFQTNLINHLNQWENTIVNYVESRIKDSENDAYFNQDLVFNKDFTQRFESNQIMEQNMHTIEEGLAALLRTESIDDELAKYQNEIIELRRQLEQRPSK